MINWTIRKKMILLLIPILIAILIIATFFTLQFSSVAQKEVAYNDTLKSARVYAHDFNAEMSDNLEISRTFAFVLDENTGMTREGVLDIQHSLLENHPGVVGVGVIFEPGTFDGLDTRYANTPGHDATGRFATYWNRLNGNESLIPVVDIETSDWYTIPKRTHEAVIMEPLLYEGVLMTSYITPIVRNHTFTGTVGVDVALESIDRTVSQVKVYDTGYAFLVSNTGIFVSSPKKEYIGRMSLSELSREKNNPGLAAMERDIHDGKEGHIEMADPFTGKNVVMFYSPIPTGNWSMVVVAPTDEMLAGVMYLSRILLLIGFITIALVGGIVIVVSRNLSEPIVAMSRTADRVAAGDLDILVPEQEGELGVLANAFNNMAARLRELINNLETKVHELQNTQAALKESEEKYRTLIEKANEVVLIVQEGVVVFANQSVSRLLGVRVEELTGKPFIGFIWPEDRDLVSKQYQQPISGERVSDPHDIRIIGPEGNPRWVFISAAGIQWQGRPANLNMITDITERKLAEDALRGSEEKFHTVADFTYDWVYWQGLDSSLIYMSPSCERITGYSPEEFLSDPHLLEKIVHPFDRSHVDEHNIFASVTPSALSLDFRIIRRDGEVRWIGHSCQQVIGSDGNSYGRRVSNRDITERKRAEEALTQVTRKLNMLNFVTFTDIQNSVFALSAYLDLARREPMDEKPLQLLEKQKMVIDRISNLLTFAKHYQDLGLKSPTWQNVQQSFLLGSSHVNLLHLIREINVQRLEIYVDPLIENVFFALSENVTRHAKTATKISLWYHENQDGLMLVFEDNGQGIPDSMKSAIFERNFMEMKGMGLFLVREVLSVTGIIIKETGEPGKGARFEITVPKGAYRFSSTDESRRENN